MPRKGAEKTASKSSGSLKRWNTYDEIPENEQDTFHRQQDKIVFGDSQVETNEDEEEYGALASGRGILDIDEESAESDVEDSDAEEDEDEEEEEDDDGEDEFGDREEGRLALSKQASSQKKAPAYYSDDEDDDEEEADEAPTGGWGPNKQSYYSTNNLDDLSSDSEMDEEERREMEVREVKKLQGKSRQGLIDGDFGLSQDMLKFEASAAAREARKKELDMDSLAKTPTSTAEALDIASLNPLQRAELLSSMQKATPETLAMIGEYGDIVEDIDIVSNRLKDLTEKDTNQSILGLCCLHHQTLLTYAANLSFYFYLRATPSYAQNPAKLTSHKVIERLLKLKTGLQLLDNFGFAADGETSDNSDSMNGDMDEENRAPEASFLFNAPLVGGEDDDEYSDSIGSLEDDELMQLDHEERSSKIGKKKVTVQPKAPRDPPQTSRTGKKTKGEKEKKRKESKDDVVAAPLAHLADLGEDDDSLGAAIKKRKKGLVSTSTPSTDVEAYKAFGEETRLSASDSADKEAKRRSLKFYTGQIDAKDARKAGGSGLGGDSDIPYRDRERSRVAVANANARKAIGVNGQGLNDKLDGDEWGENDSRDWRDVMDVEKPGKGLDDQGDDDGMDYYDLVASGKKSAKRAKKQEYDDDRASQRVAPDNDDLEDGEHRSINRAIEKNRGLTPRRPKTVRNPRVKKRLRYEKAKKQLSSRGPVYKGGQGALEGGYLGEKSGINSHVVKSRQFA
ncbi:hypothetical protein CBS101457_000559 [Exobasidium rhododendri]|nr:hypothetical protein CBS101457_000559 [Exobasidium rhododendri]